MNEWIRIAILVALASAVSGREARWLPARIQGLESEREQLIEAIDRLPQHAPKPLPDHMGYHSLPSSEGEGAAETACEIEVGFDFDVLLGAVALAPALVSGENASYAFPKRFKIEALDRGARWVGGQDGEWVVPPPPYEWVTLVDWMDADFPDPGPYPVFFEAPATRMHRLRVTIPREGNDRFHALGELYLFRRFERSPRLGDNMMAWNTVSLEATRAMNKPPLWETSYLRDGVVGLGLPLSEEVSDVEDFMAEWASRDQSADPVRIEIDLGSVRQIGRVQLWPAEAPHGMAIPQFGFPGKVLVELSEDPDFSRVHRFEINNVREDSHGDRLLNVITKANRARYVRISMLDLAEYDGKTILGVGEIRVSEYDEVWSDGAKISATGFSNEAMERLPRLVDGFSRRRRILREAEWIEGLALRRPLDRRLALVNRELREACEEWDAFKLRASLWGGGALGALLLIAMGLQRLQRRRVLRDLKHRITRDLHDEVGSSLGGITLAARRMVDAGAGPTDLAELSLMAREASASLRDVVWLTDQGRVHLPELLKKLVERAERVLVSVELRIVMPEDCPNRVVPLTFKRHLLMYFKEAVHNCARHADASKVSLVATIRRESLTLSLEDNGRGFDPEATRDGWGVDSMAKRAAEMGGRMDLRSAPGKGTTVTLCVPLSALLDTGDRSYKTSN